ncbi:MAG: vitamin K epoxide reductase family protein [Candidatus Woesearchaeota archaeon]|nr:vitamin K epoxide reductase family protein [Candidatus Woesearchaeota archaeon]
MAKTDNIPKWLFIFAIAGVLFSGYLSARKLIMQVCAFNEGCSSFLGLPTCIYGFAMFSAILILSAILLFGKKKKLRIAAGISGVAILGIIFSGAFSVKEIFFAGCPLGKCQYALLLPTCSYGLLMYIAVLITSILEIRKIKSGKSGRERQGKIRRKK